MKYRAVYVTAFILPVREVSLDIHNKMTGNNGTAIPHERNFDISKDCFS